MKIFLSLLLLVSLSAGASTLEAFFQGQEGSWVSTSADTYRETVNGEILYSRGTKFEATVTRTGNRWSFAETSCWEAEGEAPECGASEFSYVVHGDMLSIEMEGKSYPVEVLEVSPEFMIMLLSTQDYVFTAVISREGDTVSQDGVMEFPDGTKVYQLLNLLKR